MTEQQPSAEALQLVSRLRRVRRQLPSDSAATDPTTVWFELNLLHAGKAIDTLIAQRVSAETERWQERDRQRLDQIDRLQETVQSFQSARDERVSAAMRAFGRRVWSDTEEVAYRAGAADAEKLK